LGAATSQLRAVLLRGGDGGGIGAGSWDNSVLKNAQYD
jgi:hypothetical protein